MISVVKGPAMPTTKQKKRRKAVPTKIGIDKFWYFLVTAIVVFAVTYTNCVDFSSDEGEFLLKTITLLGGIFGTMAYTDRKKAKEVTEDYEEELEEKQKEISTLEDSVVVADQKV